jgi:transposase
MRYELTDNEGAIVRPLLPNKPRGVTRLDDRRVNKWHLLDLALVSDTLRR